MPNSQVAQVAHLFIFFQRSDIRWYSIQELFSSPMWHLLRSISERRVVPWQSSEWVFLGLPDESMDWFKGKFSPETIDVPMNYMGFKPVNIFPLHPIHWMKDPWRFLPRNNTDPWHRLIFVASPDFWVISGDHPKHRWLGRLTKMRHETRSSTLW